MLSPHIAFLFEEENIMYIMDIDLKLQTWEFAQRKYLPYELKLILTEKRIREWYDFWQGDVYVSLSGGLDSTYLLYRVRELYPDVEAVFCDTGLEYPELKDFIKTIPNVTIIRPEKSFRQIIKDYGYPLISKETAAKIRKLRNGNLSDRYRNYLLHGNERGKLGKLAEKWKFLIDAPFDISERCCDICKKNPFKKFHKKTGKYPFIGITQDEGFQRQRQYERTGCNIFDGNRPKSQPLGFYRKQDILRGIAENKIPYCSIYGDIKQDKEGNYYNTGVQRSGCMFCAFGCHLEKYPNRFQRMQTTHPKLYEYCMRDWDKGGLGMAYVLDYANIPYLNNVVTTEHNIQQYKLF